MQWKRLQPNLNPAGDISGVLCPCGDFLLLWTTVPCACMLAAGKSLQLQQGQQGQHACCAAMNLQESCNPSSNRRRTASTCGNNTGASTLLAGPMQAVCLLTQKYRQLCKPAPCGQGLHLSSNFHLNPYPAKTCAGRLRCCIMTVLAAPGQ